ncbi:CBN-SDC-2 protein [Caenorhabditis brenneri]|uniref:CBN-SDC-2 protein n=1 Tax=Caenorhabditis brenneri TaxID=135651 RepID=G0M6S8_CAEBE|nr:CBN-SDC-2 protein [Caenorhabditis brenneri]
MQDEDDEVQIVDVAAQNVDDEVQNEQDEDNFEYGEFEQSFSPREVQNVDDEVQDENDDSDFSIYREPIMVTLEEIEEEERNRMAEDALRAARISPAYSSESSKRRRIDRHLDELENSYWPPPDREYVETDNIMLSDDEIQIDGTERRSVFGPNRRSPSGTDRQSASVEDDLNLAMYHRSPSPVQEVAVVKPSQQQKTRPDVPPPVKEYQEKAFFGNDYLNPNKNYETKKMVEIVHDDVRPVIYRLKNMSSEKLRTQNAKRTRVTRQVAQHSILQFHEEDEETTEFRNVREANVAETIECYLKEAQRLVHKSDTFYDQVIPVALEYDSSIKTLNFGFAMKKLSCKQKQMKFQLSWWERKQGPFQNDSSGFFTQPCEPSYSINNDRILYRAHFLLQGNAASQLEKISELLIDRLTKRRPEDDVILDSSYFAREFFMTKKSISFRIQRSSDIPELFVPPTLECGYFPHSAQTIGDQMHYLAERYKEAQIEYLSLTYGKINPPRGFHVGHLTSRELYDFHCMGKHIHGFFLCWESINEKHVDINCKSTPKRFLVDMFFKIPFPLHVKYDRWDIRLKLAFDRVTVYLLHLAEICRMNRPVFDILARNESSFHQTITNAEIESVMAERETDTVSFMNLCDTHQFYSYGLAAANESYLSAFMIICGGTKVMQTIDPNNLGRTTVLNSTDQGLWLQRPGGEMYRCEDLDSDDDDDVQPSEIIVRTNFGEVEQAVVPKPMQREQKRVSRLICDLDVDNDEEDEVPRQIIIYHGEEEEVRPTRKDLIDIRRRLHNLPTPPEQRIRRLEEHQKKKPGRKPETLQDIGLKTNDFDCPWLPSDAESDYEGYLSENEDITEKVPKLRRTQSSDSIFLDMAYKDYRFNRISNLYQCCIHRPKHATAKLRRRKMNRIVQKHSLRFETIQQSNLAFKEMQECYHGNLPRLADEVARTKNCIRNPHKHRKLNVPRVFTYGDADLVDVCSQVLKDTVAHVVACENISIRAGITMTRELQDARVARRRKLETLPRKPKQVLPTFNYLAMEFFFLNRVSSRNLMDGCLLFLNNFTKRCSYYAKKQPKHLVMWHTRMHFIVREDYEFEEFLKTQQKRKRHLDRSLKQVLIENRSYQAEIMKDHERRLSRRERAEKTAARAKLPPEEQVRLAEEDRRNKEEYEKERARLKAIEKATKQVQERIIISRLNQEAAAKKINDAEEAKLRDRQRRRLEDMYHDAWLEFKDLLAEHMKREAIRKERLKKHEKKRKEAEKRKLELEARLAEERKKRIEAEARRKREEKEKNEEEARRKRLEAMARRWLEKYRKKKKQEEEKKRLEVERLEKIKKAEEDLIKAIIRQRKKEFEEEQKRKREADRRKLEKQHEVWKKEQEEKKKKELEEKRIRELEEKRIKALEAQRIRELEEKRRIQEAIKKYRAKFLVKEFAKQCYLHIRSNEEVTLVMCYEDEEGVYKTAKEAFKTEKAVELIEKVVPMYVAAYKTMSDWDEMCKLLNDFSDPTIPDELCSFGYSQNVNELAENIISGFIYKKGESLERKWFFLGNIETLLQDVHPDVVDAFVNVITKLYDPLVLKQNLISIQPSISPSLLHNFLIHIVIRRLRGSEHEHNILQVQPTASRPVDGYRIFILHLAKCYDEKNFACIPSKSFQLPDSSCSDFWKKIELWIRRNSSGSREENSEKEVLNYVTRDATLTAPSILWIYPVLGACYTLIVKKRKSRETRERIFLERKIVYTPEIAACVAEIIEQLVLIGGYFQEAICSPENLTAMFENNGFYPVVQLLCNLIRLIFRLFTCFNLSKCMKPDSTIDEALIVIFKVIEKVCKRSMQRRWHFTEDESSEVRKCLDDTIFSIQAFIDRKPLTTRDQKTKIMIEWIYWVKEHYGSKIQETCRKAVMNEMRNNHHHYYYHHGGRGEDDYDYLLLKSIRSQRSAGGRNIVDSDIEIIEEENINGRKRSRHGRQSNKRRRTDLSEDTDFPTRLPASDDPFIQQVFRTIEISFHDLSLSNREVLKTHLYDKANKNHLKESLYRFHMMEKRSDRVLRHDRYNWSQYKRRPIKFNLEAARSAENLFLHLFEHIAVSQREFRRLKWEVPRKNGLPIKPIEFFTNLKWYQSREWYNKNIVDNSLAFSFRVYHHIWFMGALAPRCYSVNSHETMPDGWCGGCTYGDVIIIPDCTCENHVNAENGNFCYTRTKFSLTDTQLAVDRFLGRFVCEHGPSSCLVLDYTEPRQNDPSIRNIRVDRQWKPFASRYTNFKSSLKIKDINSTYQDIVDKVPLHPGDVETAVNEDRFWVENAPHLLAQRKSRQANVARPGLKRRTKSEEAPIRTKKGDIRYFNRSLSCIDFTELNSYVAKKFNYARRAISPVRKTDRSKYVIPLSLDEKEVSSLEKLFNFTNHSSDSERFDLIAAMFECGFHDQDKKEEDERGDIFCFINYSHQQYGLLHVSGKPINEKKAGTNIPIPMAPIPMVAELHEEFQIFKQAWMEEAESCLMNFKNIEDEEKYKPFKMLIKCYMEIFRFNLYLFRLYLDTSEFRIFNSYAIYDAEKNRNVTFLNKRIEKFRETVDAVHNAFFNERPLLRQLEDLCEINNKHTRKQMNSYVASLCRYAVTRIRVPLIADMRLTIASWVNGTRNHEQSLEVAHLDIQEQFPPEFDEDDYLEKLRLRGFRPDIFKRIMDSFHDVKMEVAHTVLLALEFQYYDFFETIRIKMPNRMIDPMMRVFYGQQALVNVIDVLYRRTHYLTARNAEQIGNVLTSVMISGIIQKGKQHLQTGKRRVYLALRNGVDDMFLKSHEYEALPLPVYPSTIGVSFACFDNLLIISVVEEPKIIVLDECVKEKYLMSPEHQEMATLVDRERKFHVIVDKQTGELSMCYPAKRGSFKEDQFVVASKLHKTYLVPKINWDMIFRDYFDSKINRLDDQLNCEPLVYEPGDFVRVGYLERPTKRKENLKRSAQEFEIIFD